MTNWNELLASIGIGNAHLTLSLPQTVYRQGDSISGTLALKGGEVEQKVKWLAVTLNQTWQEGKASKFKELAIQRITRDSFVVQPHTALTYPFQFRLPSQARLSAHNATTTVHAEADIIWAFNPSASLNISVMLMCELQAVLNALEMLAFTETSSYFEFSLFMSSHTVDRYYRAPGYLRDQFDGLALHISAGETSVAGYLSVNRREHNLTEHFKAMVGGDREEFPLIIPRPLLRTPEGKPNGRAAIPYIKDILEKAKIAPPSEKDWLLRASSAPDDAKDILLRPAEASPDATPPDELLRPHEPEPGKGRQ